MASSLMNVRPVRLSGTLAVLEPLSMGHLPDLAEAAGYDEVWTYLDEPTPTGPESVAELIREAEEERRRGQRLPFAVVERASGKAVGSISYIDIQPRHHGVEIGWAWLTPSRWRSGIAREAATLLLRHAFEELGAIRVAFKTDSLNERSQRAIAGLGASREGLFRNHRLLRDGRIRHSVFYSITREEWPALRSRADDNR